MRDQTAIVGVGATPYYKRGQSAPQTLHEKANGAGYDLTPVAALIDMLAAKK